MTVLPYDPNKPGGLPWAAKRIQKILEREQREAMQRRRRLAREHATRQESATPTSSRAIASESVVGPVGETDLARWGRGGLLDPALWEQGMQPAAPAAPIGTIGGPFYRPAAPMPPTTFRQAAAAAPIPAPLPVPLPLPPAFIPGTPENKEFSDSTIRFYYWLKRSLLGDRGRDADCDEEWREAYRICAELMRRGGGSREMTGGYTNPYDCAKGFVSEKCGGNSVDWGRRWPTR